MVSQKKTQNFFKKALGEYYNIPDDKSIDLKELEFFCTFTKGINRIVESGTYRGVTAKRLSLIFPKVYSYEKRKKRYKNIPLENRGKNIKYIYGELNKKYLTSTTALIIDGPKRLKAIKLARKMRKRVAFVAIHDMKEYKSKLKKIFKTVKFKGVLAICW